MAAPTVSIQMSLKSIGFCVFSLTADFDNSRPPMSLLTTPVIFYSGSTKIKTIITLSSGPTIRRGREKSSLL